MAGLRACLRRPGVADRDCAQGRAPHRALPLYLHIGHRSPVWAHYLGFLSMGESRSEATRPEYLDLLHAPGEARACRDAMLPALFDPAVGRWDILDLWEIGGGSPLLACAISAGTSGSW